MPAPKPKCRRLSLVGTIFAALVLMLALTAQDSCGSDRPTVPKRDCILQTGVSPQQGQAYCNQQFSNEARRHGCSGVVYRSGTRRCIAQNCTSCPDP